MAGAAAGPTENRRHFLARKVKDAKTCGERKLLIQLKSSMGVGGNRAAKFANG
jgi:hypothetical protein